MAQYNFTQFEWFLDIEMAEISFFFDVLEMEKKIELSFAIKKLYDSFNESLKPQMILRDKRCYFISILKSWICW